MRIDLPAIRGSTFLLPLERFGIKNGGVGSLIGAMINVWSGQSLDRRKRRR